MAGGSWRDSDITAPLQQLTLTRGAFEAAMRTALEQGGLFPAGLAGTMSPQLGTPERTVPKATPASLRLTMQGESWLLLPEMISIQDPKVGVTWLDKIVACYRVLSLETPAIRCPEDMSVAIVHQSDDPNFPFAEWARQCREKLSPEFRVQFFPGATLDRSETRQSYLKAILGHRVVLFLGHMDPPGNGMPSGWRLSPRSRLTMVEIAGAMGSTPETVPELIFAGCCAGSWGDRTGGGDRCFPESFLRRGVRFFVGAWMNVIGPDKTILGNTICHLTTDFLSRWAKQPDAAVHHLYQTKRDMGFPLVASLFQIYTLGSEPVDAPVPAPQAASVAATPAPAAPPPVPSIPAAVTGPPPPPRPEIRQEPAGGLISGIAIGDRLGPYTLGPQLWTEAYSRTFWATSETSNHFVEVLTDEWQTAEMAPELDAAIETLTRAGLSDRHLIPHRREFCERQIGEVSREVLVLVYDRPMEESPDRWRTLRTLPLPRQSRENLMNIMGLGANVAGLLAELHKRGIRHGNLAPGGIAFRVPADTPEQPQGHTEIRAEVFVKNSWLRHTSPGRCTERRYGAPEERTQQDPADELKVDCWGLGVILFELATGVAPFDGRRRRPSIRQQFGPDVPEALDRIVRDCLVPDPRLRPPADQVFLRLLVAGEFDGRFLRIFEADLWTRLCAGQRLFAVWAQSSQDLIGALDALKFRGCDIFLMQEDIGVVRRSDSFRIARWREDPEVHRAAIGESRALGLPDPPAPSREQVIAYNGNALLTDALRYFFGTREAGEFPPVLLALGNAWWDAGSPRHQIAIRRLLRLCQDEYSAPVTVVVDGEESAVYPGPAVILADAYLSIDAELAPTFHWMVVPPLMGAEIFDLVLAAPATLGVPEVSEKEAGEVSKLMFPCTKRELSYAMHEAALRFGRIDRRVAEVWDEQREERFRDSGPLTFVRVSRLPEMESVGLPRLLRSRIDEWTRAMTSIVRDAGGTAAPRRVFVEGAPGYGKTTFALSLGRRLERPVLRLEAGQCLQRDLGASESQLRKTLAAASSVAGAVVLLDDADRIFKGAPQGDATLARMSTVFLHWIDNMPPSLTLVVTANRGVDLEPQWLRRMQLRIQLDHPFTMADDEYRAAVFAAAFRRHGLKSLARTTAFVEEIAAHTNPHRERLQKLHSPDAVAMADAFGRDLESGHLAALTVSLATPADIEHWVNGTLQLHASREPVETQEFWRRQLR